MNDTKPPLPPDELDAPEATETDTVDAPKKPSPPRPSDVPSSPPPPAPAPPPQVIYAPRDPMAKSPGLALFLAIFFPGLGHIYVASYERALMIIGGIAVSIWAMTQSGGRLWPLAFAISFLYFYSIFDAYREAQIANLSPDDELPSRRSTGEGRLMFGVFLVVVAGLVLADNLGLFDIRWIYDWWPVLVLLIGIYFIGSWIWEKMNATTGGSDELD
ncbi:MAG: DUF5668 domain-containing protein [Holophagae bacterium]|jgi:hypothetical protein